MAYCCPLKIKIYFFYLVFLLLTVFFTSSSFASSFDTPVRAHISAYGSNEKSKRGLFTTDFIVPLYYPDNKESLFFFNPKYTHTTPKADEINQGLGLRHIFNESFILGINAFFDRRLAHSGKWYSQTGLGLEYLSHPLDIRLNWYKPLTEAKVVDTTYGFGSTSLIQYDSKEEPLQGLDFEIGAPIFDQYTGTRAYAGGFFYQSRLSKDVNGFRLRTETRLTTWLNVDTTLNARADGQTEFIAGVRVTVPLDWGDLFKRKPKQESRDPGPADTYLQDRIFERVVRDIDIQSKSSTTQSKKYDLTYVDNSNTTGIEDGSYEHPYTKVQDGVDNAAGDKWVYIRKGNGDYHEQVELTSGITLWGSGYNGGFNGITAAGYPVMEGETKNRLQIIQASNVRVMGLDVRNCISGVVLIERSSNVTIQNCVISENRLQGGGIYLFGDDGYTTTNINIRNNLFFDNDTGAIYVYVEPGVTGDDADYDGVNIVGNTIRDNTGGVGIQFQNHTSSFKNITIADNNISDVLHGGILFVGSNDDSGREAQLFDNIKILNNTVTSSLEDGIAFTMSYGKLDNVTISNNNIHDIARYGIQLVAGVSGEAGRIIDNAVISNNTITGGVDGLIFAAYGSGSSIQAEVSRNVVNNNSRYGVAMFSESSDNDVVVDLGGGTKNSEGHNSIYDNRTYDLISDLDVDVSVVGKNNWWGQTSGPDPATISGDIDYTPWLTSDPN